MASRKRPPLKLATRRVRGELSEMGSEQLRFSTAEATALLSALRVDVPSGTLDRILDRTEGWAAGLYLAALSLSEHPDTARLVDEFEGSDAHVFDFLAGEVLEQQTAEIQNFLRRTSVLNELSGEVCDAVLGAEGSQRLLDQLESANLFLVPLDTQRRWRAS